MTRERARRVGAADAQRGVGAPAVHQAARPQAVTPQWLLDLHRFLGAATVMFTVVHVVAISRRQLRRLRRCRRARAVQRPTGTPRTSRGVVGFYLLVIEITSLLRRRLPSRAWRRVHYAGASRCSCSRRSTGSLRGPMPTTTIAVFVAVPFVGVVGLLAPVRIDRRRARRRAPAPGADDGVAPHRRNGAGDRARRALRCRRYDAPRREVLPSASRGQQLLCGAQPTHRRRPRSSGLAPVRRASRPAGCRSPSPFVTTRLARPRPAPAC